MKFELEFLEYAKKSGYHAQVHSVESTSMSMTYKTLTKESLTQKASERKYSVSLEKDGKKSHRSIVDTGILDCEKIFQEMSILCEIATQDTAESLPIITDSIEWSALYFSEEELENWTQKTYLQALEELTTTAQSQRIPENNLLFDTLGIESLSVGWSISHKSLVSTYGANKSSHNSHSSFTFGLHGKIGEESNAEWFGEGSEWLLKYTNTWIHQCGKKLHDTLMHSEEVKYTGISKVAFDRNIASELFSEFFGLLSGYAISEKMSPFIVEDIHTQILPDWIDISSLALLDENASSSWYDGNGITCLPELKIIEKGELKNLFLNVASAERLGMKPNGHPGPLNIVVSGNNSDFQNELVPSESGNFGTGSKLFDKKFGVRFLCTGLAGMHTMESTTGNFALEGEGYEILEDGSVWKFVKRVGVSGNIKKVFKEMIGHGNDFPKFGSFRIPTIVCDGIQLTK
jgi:predicted Zn-dependent protease